MPADTCHLHSGLTTSATCCKPPCHAVDWQRGGPSRWSLAQPWHSGPVARCLRVQGTQWSPQPSPDKGHGHQVLSRLCPRSPCGVTGPIRPAEPDAQPPRTRDRTQTPTSHMARPACAQGREGSPGHEALTTPTSSRAKTWSLEQRSQAPAPGHTATTRTPGREGGPPSPRTLSGCPSRCTRRWDRWPAGSPLLCGQRYLEKPEEPTALR